MNRILSGFAVGAVASILAGGIAVAEEMEEVVVTATRMVVATPAGQTYRGVPILDVTLAYGVSYSGLDLATHSGATELEKRVNDAAKVACKEISRERPTSQLTPSDAVCAKAAAEKAMVKVHELVAAAEKHAAK